MSHSPLAIANKVLEAARKRGVQLTNMQLIKLIYIAHGWSLTLLGKPLVSEPPQAWQHGPVYPTVYREFRDSGSRPISDSAKNPFSGTDWDTELSEEERAVLGKVVESYGKFHAFSLSSRTHEEGTPWSQVWRGGEGKFDPIPNDLIKSHFDHLNRPSA